jgi:hypothetical protein
MRVASPSAMSIDPHGAWKYRQVPSLRSHIDALGWTPNTGTPEGLGHSRRSGSSWAGTREATSAVSPRNPAMISESLQQFERDHSRPNETAFLMMRFGTTKAHQQITSGIRTRPKGGRPITSSLRRNGSPQKEPTWRVPEAIGPASFMPRTRRA